MKSILISIKPEYVEKILNGEKILEIRTRIPKEWKDYFNGKGSKPAPSKWYIYCTKDNKNYLNRKDCRFCYIEKRDVLGFTDKVRELFGNENGFYERLNGKVVAEFTLNEIDKIEICDPYIFRNNKQEDWKYFEKHACLTSEQMMEYIGYGEDHDGWDKKYDIGYALHIDNLIAYDKPKELSEFRKDLDCDDYPCNKGGKNSDCEYCYYDTSEGCQACGIDFDGEHCIYKTIKRPPQSWCYVEGE